MKYTKLGHSPLTVSRVCLGSMTWGLQNDQRQAFEQIDWAFDQGINFIDTAEMYAVPPTAETYGKTETIIGHWFQTHANLRKEIILATKIVGPGLNYIRDGGPISKKSIHQAVEASLKRLQTDYIDLYQLHWPNRQSPHFGKHWPNAYQHTAVDATQQQQDMLEILEGLQECVVAGKIRFCGLSNETPWGLEQYLSLAKQHNLPRMVSMQNEFHLLDHKDWPHMLESCVHHDVAYLPWSPLSSGMLTGKYLNGARPVGSRWTLTQRMGLFRNTELSEQAVAAFVEVANSHQITPVQLALGWIDQVDGITATIIGATQMTQLRENIEAFAEPLSEAVLSDIQAVIKRYPRTY